MNSLVTFNLGVEEFAVSIDTITGIIDARYLMRTHESLRSKPVIRMKNGYDATIVDMRRLLNVAGQEQRLFSAHYIVIDCGGQYIAFLADRIIDLVTVDQAIDEDAYGRETDYRNDIPIQHLRIAGRKITLLRPCRMTANQWSTVSRAAAAETVP
jgi:chemotaxis signal transduction protein